MSKEWKPDDVVGIFKGFDIETNDPEEFPIEFQDLKPEVQALLKDEKWEKAFKRLKDEIEYYHDDTFSKGWILRRMAELEAAEKESL